MTIKIIQKENPILRKISKEVEIKDILKPKIQEIINQMNEALDSENDGVAIAAPQIGIALRIFIISHKVLNKQIIKNKEDYILVQNSPKNKIFINPVIKKISKDKKLMDEGCLSVRPLYGKVRRATRATIEAYNEKGEKIIQTGSGLIAHIFQHEVDHLNGILFIDKAKNIREENYLIEN
jgi:peptide deformylase